MLASHWDIETLIIYILMGIIAQACVFSVHKKRNRGTLRKKRLQKEYIIWFIIWEIFACCRFVSPGIGGADAYGYVLYFQECLNPNTTSGYATHAEILYRLFNKAIRLFTSDYHVFFFIAYGIIIISYIVFIEEFLPVKASTVPFILIVYVYIRSFVTLRSLLAAAIVLFAIVALKRERYVWSMVFGISSIFIHKIAIFYVLFIPFYFFYKNNRMPLRRVVMWSVLSTIAARYVQKIILISDLTFLSAGSYAYFARQSIGESFFKDGWKIAFSQLLLAGGMILLNKRILKFGANHTNMQNNESVKFLRILCFYDFMMIPVNYILGIWRGYEFFYLPRLIMWGIIIELIRRIIRGSYKKIITYSFWIIFIAWIIFRLYNTWEDSRFMPYIFEPLYQTVN